MNPRMARFTINRLKKQKMRIDVYLFKEGYASSRTEAKAMVESGVVEVGNKTVTKPSFDVLEGAQISITDYEKKYVSRGGFKLECAINNFNFKISGKRAIDIGASSGGFTDCLLQNGAISVIALDSGRNQLVDKLRTDPRVTVIENYNARYLKLEDLPYSPELAVMDVSFISATYIIPSIFDVLLPGSDFICLIKPQFEVGKSNIGKGGIVKNDRIRKEAVEKVLCFAKSVGFSVEKSIVSDVVGGDGNIEYLAHFKKIKTNSIAEKGDPGL